MTALRVLSPAVRVLASAGLAASYIAALVVTLLIVLAGLLALLLGFIAAVFVDRINTIVTVAGLVLVALILTRGL